MARRSWFFKAVLGVCWTLVLSAGSALAELPEVHPLDVRQLRPSLEKQIVDIASLGSRVPGYPGHELTAELIISEFKRLGLENISIDEFGLTVPIDQGASLSCADLSKPVKLYPFWPNSVRRVTTGPEGLSGKLIYVGRGDYPDYNGQEVFSVSQKWDSDEPQAYFNLALLQMKRRQMDQAEQTLLKLLTVAKWYPEANYHLGYVYEKSGGIELAQKYYVRELNVNGGCAKAWRRYLALNADRIDADSSSKTVTLAAPVQ